MADDHMTDAEDMSVEMEPDEKDREYATQFYLEAFEPYIRDCLSMSDLRTLILLYKRFDPGERRSLSEYSCAENRTPPEVFDKIMRVIRNKEEDCLKYTAFKRACAEMKHEKISLILSGSAQPTNEVHKQLICKCGVHICNQLNIHSILPHLVSKDIISNTDCQRVQTAEQTQSNFDAAFRLLLLLPNRKVDWYDLFMDTLLEDKQEDLAEKIKEELKKMVAEGANTYTSMVVDQLPCTLTLSLLFVFTLHIFSSPENDVVKVSFCDCAVLGIHSVLSVVGHKSSFLQFSTFLLCAL